MLLLRDRWQLRWRPRLPPVVDHTSSSRARVLLTSCAHVQGDRDQRHRAAAKACASQTVDASRSRCALASVHGPPTIRFRSDLASSPSHFASGRALPPFRLVLVSGGEFVGGLAVRSTDRRCGPCRLRGRVGVPLAFHQAPRDSLCSDLGRGGAHWPALRHCGRRHAIVSV